MPSDASARSDSSSPQVDANILVVGNLEGLFTLEEIRAHRCAKLIETDSVAEALQYLEEQDFALVLLDWRMDGLATAKRIRALERSRHTPILFLAEVGDLPPIEEAYALGGVEHLVAPVPPVVLRCKVAGYLDLFRKNEQLRRLEHREREHPFAAEHARFRVLTEHSSDAVSLVGSDGVVFYTSPSSRRVMGYEPDEFVGRDGFEVVHPDDQERTQALLAEVVETPGKSITAEMRVRHRDGSWRWVESVGTNLLHEPSVKAVVVNFRDVTERKRAEEALRESEERFRLLTEVIPQLVWSSLPDGFIDYCNPRWLDYTGLRQEQVQGDGWAVALHTDDQPATMAAWKRAIEKGKEYQVEQRLRSKQGAYRWFLTRALPLRDAAGKVVKWFGTCTDIENWKQTEEEKRLLERNLQESQKLESLGVLAGGIAHDFNNLLTTILGYASLIDMRLPAGSPLREDLGRISQVAERAADLCRQMLAYSGRGRFVLGSLDLNEVIREIIGLLGVSLSRKVVPHFDLAEGLPPILADATQVRQVILNLVLNAAEAIGDRPGLIRVATTVRRMDRASLTSAGGSPDLPEGDYVVLEVADTGCGMDEETRRRIFEPFFTTKFTGRGLGLAAVLGIVRGHKGAIQVESEPGRGSTFRLLLPSGPNGVHPKQACPALAMRWQGEGIILVADDENHVRDVAERMLKTLGFRVIQAGDGEEALARLRESADEVRLVLLDLTMPKLDGEETFRTLHLLWPGLPVILMSGYSEHEASARFTGKGLAGFLAKPFRLEELTERVRSALETNCQAIFPAPGERRKSS
jgi:PAS domain S-box-containing protein